MAKKPAKQSETSTDALPEAGGGEKRLRQGNAPACPNCSEGADAVICQSGGSDPFFTRYYCPNRCGYSEKVPRPRMLERVRRAKADDEDFSAR